jgi:hypothetical protein
VSQLREDLRVLEDAFLRSLSADAPSARRRSRLTAKAMLSGSCSSCSAGSPGSSNRVSSGSTCGDESDDDLSDAGASDYDGEGLGRRHPHAAAFDDALFYDHGGDDMEDLNNGGAGGSRFDGHSFGSGSFEFTTDSLASSSVGGELEDMREAMFALAGGSGGNHRAAGRSGASAGAVSARGGRAAALGRASHAGVFLGDLEEDAARVGAAAASAAAASTTHGHFLPPLAPPPPPSHSHSRHRALALSSRPSPSSRHPAPFAAAPTLGTALGVGAIGLGALGEALGGAGDVDHLGAFFAAGLLEPLGNFLPDECFSAC